MAKPPQALGGFLFVEGYPEFTGSYLTNKGKILMIKNMILTIGKKPFKVKNIFTPYTKFYLFNFFIDLHFFGAVLIPFFEEWGGINKFMIQLIQAWFMLWIFVLEIPTGFISDKIGHKISILTGTFIYAIAAFVYASYPSISVFLAGEFGMALAISFISGAHEAWLVETTKVNNEHHLLKKKIGVAHSFSLGGILVASLFGGYIAEHFGLNAPLVFGGIANIIAFVIFFTAPSPPKYKQEIGGWQAAKDSIQFIKNKPEIRRLATNLIMVSTVSYFVIWIYQSLLKENGIPTEQFGYYHALFLFVEIIICLNFEQIEKLFGTNGYLKLSAVTIGFAFLLTAIWPSTTGILIFIVLGGSVGLSRWQFGLSHLHEHIPSEQRATIGSGLSMWRRAGTMLANPFIGWLLLSSFWLPLTILGLFAISSLLVFPKSKV